MQDKQEHTLQGITCNSVICKCRIRNNCTTPKPKEMILSSTHPSTYIKNIQLQPSAPHYFAESYFYYFSQVFHDLSLSLPPNLSLLSFQAAHLHQYLVEDLQQTLSEKNAQFVLHSDELNSRQGNSGLQLDHYDHRPASHHLLGRGKNGLKKKRK